MARIDELSENRQALQEQLSQIIEERKNLGLSAKALSASWQLEQEARKKLTQLSLEFDDLGKTSLEKAQDRKNSPRER